MAIGAQKEEDDKEIVEHRIRMVELLEKTIRLERIMSMNDILFADKKSGNIAKIEAITKRDAKYTKKLTCDICGRKFKEIQSLHIHSSLLYCNHDGTVNQNVKKHLTSEKYVRLVTAHLRLTKILDTMQDSINKYPESKRLICLTRPEPENIEREMNTDGKRRSKKRKYLI